MAHEGGGGKMPKKLSTWFMEALNCTAAALKNARNILKSFQISSPVAKFAFYSLVIKGKLF